MILKFKYIYSKCCLISTLFICVFQCESLRAKAETFLVNEGTPELVPRKVIFTYYYIFVFISGLNLDF